MSYCPEHGDEMSCGDPYAVYPMYHCPQGCHWEYVEGAYYYQEKEESGCPLCVAVSTEALAKGEKVE